MTQQSPGHGRIWEQFTSIEDRVANTAVPRTIGQGNFLVVGQGMADSDSGAPFITGTNGTVRLTTNATDQHTLGLETSVMFDVALMGPLVAEARVSMPNVTTKSAFMGFTDIAIASDIPDIQVDLITAASGTLITVVASDYVGFYLDSELADDQDWHAVHAGGTRTDETDAAAVNLTSPHTVVDGEFQMLRLEVDPNGTARWYVDGLLAKTTVGAVSTSVNLKFFIAVCAKTTTVATMDVNSILLEWNNDQTV